MHGEGDECLNGIFFGILHFLTIFQYFGHLIKLAQCAKDHDRWITKSENNEKSTLGTDQRSLLCWIAQNEIDFLFRFSKSRPGLFSAYLTGITPPMTEADLAAQRLADAALQQQLRMSGFASDSGIASDLGMVLFILVLFYVIFIWHHWSIRIKGF